jgi:hypothetical protein
MLIASLALTQTGCATIHFSSSMEPGTGDTGSNEPPGGSSGSSSTGNIVGITTIVVVGGYLVYRAITGGPDEDEGEPALEPSPLLGRGTPEIRPHAPDTTMHSTELVRPKIKTPGSVVL